MAQSTDANLSPAALLHKARDPTEDPQGRAQMTILEPNTPVVDEN
ncbi:uncharacterized protein FRV6_12298 [Fusarium oxysporum]|uniref:Uncharacterized protein n=1 Tax=Fusarium oxysporum TaxID=5507 RepID=A0A2H3TR02_FUSOX|nr:uncharacterized protein FRV6_12298 [Fusarium oxysporum]